MKAEPEDDMKGQYKDTMKGMFSKKGRQSENFHEELQKSLDENKRKFDRQLLGDWVMKVYQRCTNQCIKDGDH